MFIRRSIEAYSAKYYLVLSLGLLTALPLIAAANSQVALSAALRGSSAIAVAVDVANGKEIAAVGSLKVHGTPGSLLKPLFLASALEQREVLPQSTVFCRRSLRIRSGAREWNLACTHPQSNVAFPAKEALAYSCNQYFAALADRIPPAQVSAILNHYGLPQTPPPQTREQKELLVLGVAGILVSPAQVATAYRRLTLQLNANEGLTILEPVRQGLTDSVGYGMANNANIPGMTIAGKTGTASDPGGQASHGWFAGNGYLGRRQVVIVIYLPHGNGADAARLAQHFFLAAGSSLTVRSK